MPAPCRMRQQAATRGKATHTHMSHEQPLLKHPAKFSTKDGSRTSHLAGIPLQCFRNPCQRCMATLLVPASREADSNVSASTHETRREWLQPAESGARREDRPGWLSSRPADRNTRTSKNGVQAAIIPAGIWTGLAMTGSPLRTRLHLSD